MDIPADIFTEPDKAVDTLANLGPLRRLAGIWEGRRGHDVNPKADGPEHRDFYERIELQPIDAQPNGPQLFYGLRYHTHINSPEEQITFVYGKLGIRVIPASGAKPLVAGWDQVTNKAADDFAAS